MRGHLIVLSLLAGVIVPTSSALVTSPQRPKAGSGGIGIQLVAAPADSQADPLARVYIVDRLAPGTSIRRQVEISNSTKATATVAVYPAAADITNGTFGFAPAHGRNELSSWTSVSQRVLRLPSGNKAFETVTIKVPREASTGERYAVIWAEVSMPAAAAGGVTLVNRVGIRMYLSIGPGGAPPAAFVSSSLSATRAATGAPLVVATIHNTGQRTIDISGSLTLSNGPGGLGAGPFPVKLATALAPHESQPMTLRLDKRVPRGPWRVQLRLSNGLVQHAAVATITFPVTRAPRNRS